jgi:hypothetical protein
MGIHPQTSIGPSLLNSRNITFAVIGVILAFLIVNPIIQLVIMSFSTPEGELTFGNYVEAYGELRYLQAVWHSLLLGLGVATLSAALALPIAWAVARTDMPMRGANPSRARADGFGAGHVVHDTLRSAGDRAGNRLLRRLRAAAVCARGIVISAAPWEVRARLQAWPRSAPGSPLL